MGGRANDHRQASLHARRPSSNLQGVLIFRNGLSQIRRQPREAAAGPRANYRRDQVRRSHHMQPLSLSLSPSGPLAAHTPATITTTTNTSTAQAPATAALSTRNAADSSRLSRQLASAAHRGPTSSKEKGPWRDGGEKESLQSVLFSLGSPTEQAGRQAIECSRTGTSGEADR